MKSISQLAVINLVRASVRTGAVLVYLASLTAVLFIGAVLYLGVGEISARSAARLGADAVIMPEGRTDDIRGLLLAEGRSKLTMPGSLAERVRRMPEVADATAQLFVVSGPLACCALSDTLLVGFEPERDFTLVPWLRERVNHPLEDDEVIVGSNILAEPGGRIVFYGIPFRIAGKLQPTGVGQFDATVFIPMRGARKMFEQAAREAGGAAPAVGPDQVSVVMVRFKAGVNADAAALKIESLGQKVILADAASRRLRAAMLGPVYIVLASGAIQWVTGLAMVGALFAVMINSRRPEFALMRAVGARAVDVRRMLIGETLMVGLSAGIAGVVLAALVLWPMRGLLGGALGVSAIYPPATVIALVALVSIAFCVLTSLLCAVYPLYKTSSPEPHE